MKGKLMIFKTTSNLQFKKAMTTTLATFLLVHGFIQLITTNFVSAQESNSSGEVRIIEPVNENSVVRYSSEYNRMNKSFGLTLLSGNYGPGNMAGLSGHYYFDRNSLLRLDVAAGRPYLNEVISSVFGTESKIEISNIVISYQKFLGNSFFIRGGLGFKSVNYLKRNYNTNSDSLFSSTPYEWKFKGSSVDAMFTLGNEWQWTHFTLGVDWIGVSVPMTSKVESESFYDESLNKEYYYSKYFKDDQEYLLKKTWGYALNLRLGASF